MYRKPYMDKLERVQKLGRRELAENIRDITGWTQNESQTAIEAVTLAVQIWLEAMVRDIPEGAKAELSISGFGTFMVTYGVSFRPGSGNRSRRSLGLPPVPKMEVDFHPSRGLTEQIKEINRQAKMEADSLIEGKDQEGRKSQHQEKIAHR